MTIPEIALAIRITIVVVATTAVAATAPAVAVPATITITTRTAIITMKAGIAATMRAAGHTIARGRVAWKPVATGSGTTL